MDFKKIRFFIFAFALAAITYYFWVVIRVFAYPLFWAAVIAAISYPFYQKINTKIKRQNLSVAITIILVTIIILIPVTILGTLVLKESINLYGLINDNSSQISESLRHTLDTIKNNPYMSKLHINEDMITARITEVGQTSLRFILNSIKDFTQNSLTFVVMFILMLYALFFFLRDGEKFLKKVIHLCPLGDKYELMLYQQFTSTARATLKGTVIVGIIQGILGGIMFWIAGIPGALIWGIIMTILSILPGIGCALAWLPAAIILILLGDVWQGVMIILVGTLLIGTIDNLLRPFLVGKDIRMHELLIFFSTLGGIVVFGASGFIIGPIIASLFVALWNIYEHYYRMELNHNKQ